MYDSTFLCLRLQKIKTWTSWEIKGGNSIFDLLKRSEHVFISFDDFIELNVVKFNSLVGKSRKKEQLKYWKLLLSVRNNKNFKIILFFYSSYLLQSNLNCSSVSGSLWKSRIDRNLVKLTFPLFAISYKVILKKTRFLMPSFW